MSTNKNITIKQYNGSDYDVLYPATIVSQVSGAISSDEKGTANGVASLGSDGKVPNTQLPVYQVPITASGILKGDGTGGVSAAVAGTDFANGETQAKVMAVSVPSKDYIKTALELQAFLDSLPKFLNDDIKIFVTGEVTTPIVISGFHGSGQFDLRMSGATLHGGMKLENCGVEINISDCVLDTANFSDRYTLYVSNCNYVYLLDVTLTGDGTNDHWGIACGEGSLVACERCTINSFGRAVLCENAAVISLAGGTYSGNAYGAYVYHGGIIMLADGAPDTLGGASNIHVGGIIVKANGTPI